MPASVRLDEARVPAQLKAKKLGHFLPPRSPRENLEISTKRPEVLRILRSPARSLRSIDNSSGEIRP